MALIFKVAEEQNSPMWYKDNGTLKHSGAISEEETLRIASLPKEIDEEALVKELDIIEARGSSGEVYHYSSSWNEDFKNTIKEYSILSNCKAFEVDPSNEEIQAFASLKKQEGLQKTASVLAPVESDSLTGKFLIDSKFEDEIDDGSEKERLKGIEKSKSGMPAVEAKGVTVSRSHSDLDDNNAGIGMRPGKGRNVIQDPNSIGRYADSKEEDVGVRLRRERLEREQVKIAQRKAEQKAKAKEIDDAGYGAADIGNFRLTEAVEVQGSVLGRIARKVEMTDGEKISMRHTAAAKVLADKKAEAKKQWNRPQGSSKPSVSDDFANALKTELGKIQ